MLREERGRESKEEEKNEGTRESIESIKGREAGDIFKRVLHLVGVEHSVSKQAASSS